MSFPYVVTHEETNDSGTLGTGTAAIVGRFTVSKKETLENHGSKMALRYLAKCFLDALMTVEGRIEELTTAQVEELRDHKTRFEKTENETIELTDWEYMAA